jgi:hypothetical protein
MFRQVPFIVVNVLLVRGYILYKEPKRKNRRISRHFLIGRADVTFFLPPALYVIFYEGISIMCDVDKLIFFYLTKKIPTSTPSTLHSTIFHLPLFLAAVDDRFFP